MQPKTALVQPIKLHKLPKQRHFLAVFFISFMWGIFGADRMYLGKWGTGILKLLTIGGLGIWLMIDLSTIMSGAMRDKQGREMLQYSEYKQFAARTVFIFTMAFIVLAVISAASLINTIMMLMDGAQGGIIPGLGNLKGLTGGAGGTSGLTPEQLNELGL